MLSEHEEGSVGIRQHKHCVDLQWEGPAAGGTRSRRLSTDAELPVRRFIPKPLETVNFPSKAVLRMKQFPLGLQQLGNVQLTGRGKPFVLPPFQMHDSQIFSAWYYLFYATLPLFFSIKRVSSLLRIRVPFPPVSHISQHLLGSCYFLPKRWLHLQGLSSSNMES